MWKWTKRIFAIGVLAVILTVVGLSIFAYIGLKSAKPPDIETAPYGVQSYYQHDSEKFPSRIYYAEKIEIDGGKAMLTNYWTYDGARYHHHSGEMVVDPPFTIIRRLQ